MESTLKDGKSDDLDHPGTIVNSLNDSDRLAYNARIATLRGKEYPMLQDQIYLDHAGTTIPSASLLSAFAIDLTTNLYGNPHSFASGSSQKTSLRIDNVRLKVLRLFGADPTEYDVVFVANATAGVKLVAETFACQDESFEYVYHRDSHTSIVGVRELAKKSTCLEDDEATESWLASLELKDGSYAARLCPTLFAYPAQSNMDGRRLPLSWTSRARGSGQNMFTLLDAAAYVSTSPLDLEASHVAPDFIVMSFYKMFGFPDLGALLVRKSASHVFQARKYFGGGTVETVACTATEQWHFKKGASMHDGLEDGTLPIHDIIALDLAIENHAKLFGSMSDIAAHTNFLASRLHAQLSILNHGNGSLVCEIYSNQDAKQRPNGPVLTFNLRSSTGAFVSHHEFHKLASIRNIHTRTGNLCNPGGVSRVLNMNAEDLLDNYAAGLRCGGDQDIIRGRPTGVIRISFGAMSTLQDVEAFSAFIKEFFVEEFVVDIESTKSVSRSETSRYYVKSLVVYPIKSCGGYSIPHGVPWSIRPRGLAWDREWCLVHQGTRKPLSQKRYPELMFFKPELDLLQDLLKVTWIGPPRSSFSNSLSLPLAMDEVSVMDRQYSSRDTCATNLCSNETEPFVYQTDSISDFFSTHLGVPVHLARILPPVSLQAGEKPGQRELFMDEAMQYEQYVPGSFPTPPASPLLSEQDAVEMPVTPVSLANESPILVVFEPSLRTVNSLLPYGVEEVRSDTFRANIVLDSVSQGTSSCPSPTTTNSPRRLPEDDLTSLEFDSSINSSKTSGTQLQLLAPCRRCQMITLDQSTGQRRPEIFAHMAKIRRWNGGVWFGVHAALKNSSEADTNSLEASIEVGDVVTGR